MMKSLQLKSLATAAVFSKASATNELGDRCCNIYRGKNFTDFYTQMCLREGDLGSYDGKVGFKIESLECGKDIAFTHQNYDPDEPTWCWEYDGS